MSCAPQHQSFRLLDARTGWEAASSDGLTGLGEVAGLRLAPRVASPGAVHVADVYRCLYPAEVAVDPSGRLFVVAPDDRTRLRVLDLATGCWSDLALPDEPVSIAGLSWGRGLLAVADEGAGRVLLLRGTPLREVLRVELAGLVRGRPVLVAVTPWSLLAVVTRDPAEVALVGMDGLVRRRGPLPVAATAAELGMACVADEDGERPALLLSVRLERGWRRLLRLDPAGTLAATVVPASALQCPRAPAVRIEAGDDERWSIDRGDDGQAWPVRRYVERGRLRTVALDSGTDDCEWHRIRLDVDRPPGTGVDLRLAIPAAGGTPSDRDWRPLPPGAGDALVIGERRGRHLWLELELFGDGRDTPVVRAVRADFNVTTSLARLPAVYRPDPTTPGVDPRELLAAEFTRQFLSLFDATFEELDEVIALAPLLLDPAGLPDHVLPALAARIGIRADPSWPPDRLRRLLADWPRVSPLLGTPHGLCRLVAIVYGVNVLIEESGRLRPWDAVGHARLGQVRLFGLSRSSLRLGSGRLGEALLEPDADRLAPAYGSGAYRCTVHVPARLPERDRPGLEALVRAFLPAHVGVSVRYARPAVRVGPPLAVGVATLLDGLPPAVLGGDGERAVVLGRRGVLAGGRDGGAAVTVGRRAVAGITR